MSFLFAAVALIAAGLALLELLHLRTRDVAVDAALAWFVGAGWFALASAAGRFLLGIPFRPPLAIAALASPLVAWGAARLYRARRSAPDADAATLAEPPRARWIPRPLWLWVPIASFAVIVSWAILVQGVNSPTATDDGVRVRAYTPILAWEDAWPAEARALFQIAGAVPTFVPAAAWVFTGSVDHFHANYAVLADFVALLVLVIALASARGRPERGWGAAFGLLCLPLLVYNLTTTYQDAVLALHVGAALLFAMESWRLGSRADLARALLLLLAAAMVKREGELLAASLALAFLAVAAWDDWLAGRPRAGRLALLVAVPGVLLAATKVAVLGSGAAFPAAGLFAARLRGAGLAAATAPTADLHARAAEAFVSALFRSGNSGGLYWALLATALVRVRRIFGTWLGRSLGIVVILLAEVAISSVWLIPEFTIDQTTVHRALLVASVPAVLWLAAAIDDAAAPE